MKRPLLAAALVASLLAATTAACSGGSGGGGGESGRVTVQLIVPPEGSPDPFLDVASYRVRVLESGAVVRETTYDANEDLVVLGLTEGADRTVQLDAFDAATTRVAHGTTLPFDFIDGENVTVTMYFARSNSFNGVHGSTAGRSGASTAVLSDGSVLIAGGLVGGTAVATAEIFDFETDSVLPSGTMGSPHAYASVALLDANTVLVAGGHDGTGAPLAAADVFVYQPASSAGSWASGVPPMSEPRREAGAAGLAAGVALVAGGVGTGAPLDTTEIFQWNGTTGAWAGGPAMAVPRRGPIVLELGASRAIVGGGRDDQGGGGGPSAGYDKTSELFTWNGAAAAKSGTSDFREERSLPAIVKLDATRWLLAGGQNGLGVLDSTEVVTLDGAGTDFNSADGPNLPVAHRRGGGGLLADGDTLLLGGDDGTGDAIAATDDAFLYDGTTITAFTPTPGPTATSAVIALPDGTALIVIDGRVLRYNP